MTSPIADLVAWARARGLHAQTGEECVRDPEELDRFSILDRHSLLIEEPTINFGRWAEVIPGAVVYPTKEPELVSLVQELFSRGLSYRVRGRGHSSGDLGLATSTQVLIDLSRLADVAPLLVPADSVSIAASATLGQLVDVLAALNRRPLGLPTNLAQSIGGTIAVGGFTESCHLHGLFAEAMSKARVVTHDGNVVEVAPGDPRFEAIPGGVGENGIVTAVGLRSSPGDLRLEARMMRWRKFEDFLPDAMRIAQLRLYQYFRPRIVSADEEVHALVGNYSTDVADSAPKFLKPSSMSAVEQLDLHAALRTAAQESKPFACPAVELVFPFPSEQARAIEFARDSLATLGPHLPRGIAIALARGGSRFPLAPLPCADWGLMIAVRPELPPRDAAALVPSLRSRIARTLEKSGAIRYRVSI